MTRCRTDQPKVLKAALSNPKVMRYRDQKPSGLDRHHRLPDDVSGRAAAGRATAGGDRFKELKAEGTRDQPFSTSGRWKYVTKDVGYVGRRLLLIGLVCGAGLGIAAVLLVLGFRWWWCSLLGLALVVLIDRLGKGGRRLDPFTWVKGADGECQVSRTLHDLEAFGYRTIDHVDIGRGDVDHVVVGPTGVFAVETKNWPGRVDVRDGVLYRNGHRDDACLRQAIRGAIAIRERAGLRWVEAIVACVNANVQAEPVRSKAVTVVSSHRLNGTISDRRMGLDTEEIERIAASLSRSVQRSRSVPNAVRAIAVRPSVPSSNGTG